MERRMLVAIVLSVAAMFIWLTFFAKKPQKAPDTVTAAAPGAPGPVAVPGTEPVTAPAMDGGVPIPGAPVPPPGPAPVGFVPVQKADHREWNQAFDKGEFLDVEWTTRGGAIAALRLRTKYEMCERDRPKRQPLDVLVPVEPDWLTGMTTLDAADTEKMRTLDWTQVPSADGRVVFSFVTTTGWRVTKSFVFPTETDRYDIELSIAVERVSGPIPKDAALKIQLLGAAGLAKEPSSHTSIDEASRSVVFIAGKQDDPQFHPAGFLPLELDAPELSNRSFRYAGIQSPYFFASVYTDGSPETPAVSRVWGGGGDTTRNAAEALERLKRFYKDRRDRVAEADGEFWARLKEIAGNFQTAWVEFDPLATRSTGKATTPFHLYAGPLSRNVFSDDRYHAISNVITYQMAPDWLARLLLAIFDLFKGLTGSAGLAVLMMTLAVRGGLMPLSIKNQLSMRRHGRKVAKLKPKLEALKKRFTTDPRKFREEQVKLFREHGIGFPMGCIMMLLQIPIFFSLFAALRVEFGLRHEAFAWIRDLSGPDRLVDFGLAKGLSLIGIPPGGGISALNILPLLYMGLAIYQQRLMPKAMDEQQAQQMKMAKWMAIIFPVLLYNYTAALALYMCMSSIIAIIEGRVVRSRDAKDAATT